MTIKNPTKKSAGKSNLNERHSRHSFPLLLPICLMEISLLLRLCKNLFISANQVAVEPISDSGVKDWYFCEVGCE